MYLLKTLAKRRLVRKYKPISMNTIKRTQLKKPTFMAGRKMSGKFAVVNKIVILR